ncbi:MAG: cation:proton antiporter, partial [Planctomycetes bacterium]|nr:cation:proton antiporter [Planctomycetota bacterium]
MIGPESVISVPSDTIARVGIALLLAFSAGKVASRLHVPKVTGYILAGFFLGPSVSGLFSKTLVHDLQVLSDIALGLILFNIGGEFKRELLKQMGMKSLKFTFSLVTIVFTVTATSCFLASYLSAVSLSGRLFMAIYLGFIAIATAPPTTLLVINEYNARGPVTRHVMIYLLLGTMIALIGGQTALRIFETAGLWGEGKGSLLSQMGLLAWNILGAIFVGILL